MDSRELLYSKQVLRFKENGKFRILCISDIHGGVGYDEYNTIKNIRALIEAYSPDAVLMLGDIAGPGIIHISTPDELRTMLSGLVAPMEDAGIPWAHVYGNHDNNFGVDNRVAQNVYEEFSFCVSKTGPDNLPGCGNWVVPVLSSKNDSPAFCIWGMDSHRGNDGFKSENNLTDTDIFVLPVDNEFDCSSRGIDFSQVMWYAQASADIEKEYGRKIPGIMTMHVPLYEMGMISYLRDRFVFDGYDDGEIDCQGINSGLFRACLERGDIKAICFGHNHRNNFSTEYCGIKLCYDGYLSMHACHRTNTLGGRIFDIDESNPFEINTQPVLVRDVLKLDGCNYEW